MLKNLLIYLTHPHVGVWNLESRHVDQFSEHLPQLQVDVCHNSNEFKEKLQKSEAVAVWFFKREWLDSAPRLKLIATPAAGTEWIDVEPKEGLELLHGGFHGIQKRPVLVIRVHGLVARGDSKVLRGFDK